MSDTISKYGNYIEENTELFESSDELVGLILDDVKFEGYKASLIGDLQESEDYKTVSELFDRQREAILEEASEMLGSAEAVAYAVASFPILVDVYSQPVLSKVVSTYPSSKPVMSIPRLKWEVTSIDHNGNKTSFDFQMLHNKLDLV